MPPADQRDSGVVAGNDQSADVEVHQVDFANADAQWDRAERHITREWHGDRELQVCGQPRSPTVFGVVSGDNPMSRSYPIRGTAIENHRGVFGVGRTQSYRDERMHANDRHDDRDAANETILHHARQQQRHQQQTCQRLMKRRAKHRRE